MQTIPVSEKTIGAFAARRQFGKLLQDVMAKGDTFVVERNGEPIAAVVPVRLYEQWKRRREAFFEQIRASAHTAKEYEDLSEEAVTALVNAEIQAHRAEKRLKP